MMPRLGLLALIIEWEYQTMNTENSDVEQGNKGGIMRKLLIIFVPIAILLFAILAIVILSSLQKAPEISKKERPVLAVMATPAYQDTIQLNVHIQGESRPRTEIDLVPEVGGKVVFVSDKFIPGGIFKKGEVLIKIDPTDYNVAVVRAEAALAQARQGLIREEAESDIVKRDWEELGDGRPASDLTLRKPQLLQAKATLQSAEADLENARIRLRRTEVRAPFNGRVRDKFADLGQYVNPGSRLGKIFSTDSVEVRLALTDADLAKLDLPFAYDATNYDKAPDVKISAVVGGKKQNWVGKLVRTDAAFDPQTRSLFALAEVRNPYSKNLSDKGQPLAPGLFVDAEIQGMVLKDKVIIPRDGLRPSDKVYIVNQDGKAESRDVTVLDSNPERAVLDSGVKDGEFVILSPLERSQISLNFKALDIDDTTNVLVEPKAEKDEGKDKDPLKMAEEKLAKAATKQKKAKKEFVQASKEMSAAKKAYKMAKKRAKHDKGKKGKSKDSKKKKSKKNSPKKDKSETENPDGAKTRTTTEE